MLPFGSSAIFSSGKCGNMKIFILCLLINCTICNASKTRRRLPVGALFTGDEIDEEIAFRSAINKANSDLTNFELVPIVKYFQFDDSFIVERLACDIIADGAVAIFGPSSRKSSGIVSSICSSIGIPHIVYHWREEEKDVEKSMRTTTINIFPDTLILSKAYADIVIEHGWKSFAVIYETGEGLMKLQDILHITNPSGLGTPILTLGDGPDYRPLLKKAKRFNENNFILDCSLDKVLDVIEQAHEINLLGEDRSLFLSNFHSHTIDFQKLPLTKLNITSIRLSHPDHLMRRAIYEWTSTEADQGRNYNMDRERVKNSMILIHDAVKLFATALKTDYTFKDMQLPHGDCNANRKWYQGNDLVYRMKWLTRNNSLVQENEGFITGRMDLDKFGERSYFKVDITVLYAQYFHKLISWNPEDGIVDTHEKEDLREKIGGSIQNKTFIVSTRLGAPFLVEKIPQEGEILEGNSRYEGYSIDLIHSLSEKLKFKYVFKLVPDKRYGGYNKKTKKWDGIIRQLIDGKADMGICDLTMTYERRQAVDFTVPFMTLGISILFAKPVKPTPNLFSFLLPYSVDVWTYTAVICAFIIVVLFIAARISDDEWDHIDVVRMGSMEIKRTKNTWNLANRFWLTMGSLMGQGCDLLPRGVPMRLITGVWWFFALMLLNSYTANLAAFLTMSRIEEAINDVEDLGEQTKIKYGVVQGGATMMFFKDSNDSLYRKMWASMENAQPAVFVGSNEEGMERVLKGRRLYAFLMESTILEYITERHCDLTEVGSRFGDKFYGIAMPLNSRYRTIISQELLRMSERGELYNLKMKWWKNRGEGCAKEASIESNELTIEEVGGVFIVLITGLFFAFVLGFCEFFWSVHKIAARDKVTLKEAFKSQAMFAVRFWLKYKPVRSKSNEGDISRKSSKASLKKWEIKNDKINKTD